MIINWCSNINNFDNMIDKYNKCFSSNVNLKIEKKIYSEISFIINIFNNIETPKNFIFLLLIINVIHNITIVVFNENDFIILIIDKQELFYEKFDKFNSFQKYINIKIDILNLNQYSNIIFSKYFLI